MKKIFMVITCLLMACKNEKSEPIVSDENLTEENFDFKNDIESPKTELNYEVIQEEVTTHSKVLNDSIITKKAVETIDLIDEFANLKDLSNDFVYDIKYATADNFLGQAVYDCPECYLRKETALALIKANKVFKDKGYRILIYDCYRPLDVQKKMWAILPGTHYVANPKRGSKHNRGAAVDLTLIDKNGKIVDMGTAFDYFGKEAHHTYTNLPKEVLDNRKLLRETMNEANFKHIYSEWWHYEYRPETHKEVSNFKWDCE